MPAVSALLDLPGCSSASLSLYAVSSRKALYALVGADAGEFGLGEFAAFAGEAEISEKGGISFKLSQGNTPFGLNLSTYYIVEHQEANLLLEALVRRCV